MKNFITILGGSHGHHGSKRHELAQHALSHGSHAFTHTLTSTQLQPRCSYYRIWIQIFTLKVPYFMFEKLAHGLVGNGMYKLSVNPYTQTCISDALSWGLMH